MSPVSSTGPVRYSPSRLGDLCAPRVAGICVSKYTLSRKLLLCHHIQDQRAHSNRKLRFQGFCRSIRLIERVFWSFYSTVRSDMQSWLAFSWPYNLLSDKVLRITVYSCANAPAGPPRADPPASGT